MYSFLTCTLLILNFFLLLEKNFFFPTCKYSIYILYSKKKVNKNIIEFNHELSQNDKYYKNKTDCRFEKAVELVADLNSSKVICFIIKQM